MGMIKLPTTRIIWDRRKTAQKDGVAAVEMEVTYMRKRKWISTGVKASRREWNERTQRVWKREDMYVVNERIGRMAACMDELAAELKRKEREFEWWMVEVMMEGGKVEDVMEGDQWQKWRKESFVDWVEERIRERKDLRAGTLRTHEVMLRTLKAWGGMVTFGDVTRRNIMLWENWLRQKANGRNDAEGQKAQTTIYGYHKRLKRYVHEAVMLEMIKENPYDKMKLERGRSEGVKYLVKEEVERLWKLEVKQETIERVRDVFVFQCYTGLAYADLARFDFDRCEERDGRWWLRDERVKSEEVYELLLLPRAMEILRKYGMRLPVISNQQYNMRLKVLGEMAGVKVALTSHVGRHSFAVMALNSGVPVETLAKMMGHTQIQTTQVYAKVLGKSVEGAFRMLEEKL